MLNNKNPLSGTLGTWLLEKHKEFQEAHIQSRFLGSRSHPPSLAHMEPNPILKCAVGLSFPSKTAGLTASFTCWKTPGREGFDAALCLTIGTPSAPSSPCLWTTCSKCPISVVSWSWAGTSGAGARTQLLVFPRFLEMLGDNGAQHLRVSGAWVALKVWL